LYDPIDEAGIAYNDPSLAISWPVTHPFLSKRDALNPPLSELMASLASANALPIIALAATT
jgi:dTDP-4-dehydrorhamnose 3,5-epimerase